MIIMKQTIKNEFRLIGTFASIKSRLQEYARVIPPALPERKEPKAA